MSISKINKKILKFFLIIIAFILVYYVFGEILISQLNYKDITIMKGLFTNEDLEYARNCTNNSTDVSTPCYKKFHTNLISKIKKTLNIDFLHIDHARFSNGNNHDGKSLHRDIKPLPHLKSQEYPRVYTIVVYLDNAIIQIGNKTINAEPGDVIMFNSFYLHRSKGLSISKQRRIIQFFEVFIDENEYNRTNDLISHCGFTNSRFIVKYIYQLFDIRIFIEYLNISSSLWKKQNCGNDSDTKYIVLINSDNYLETIENVKYYRDI
jgi:hypothetical protein